MTMMAVSMRPASETNPHLWTSHSPHSGVQGVAPHFWDSPTQDAH